MIFSAYSFSLFSIIFSMTAWVPDEADRSVVLALLQVVFLEKCDDHQLGLQDKAFSSLRDLVTGCCESCDYVLSTSLDQFCWDIVNSSWLLFSQCIGAPTFQQRSGWPFSVFVWGRFSTDGSHDGFIYMEIQKEKFQRTWSYKGGDPSERVVGLPSEFKCLIMLYLLDSPGYFPIKIKPTQLWYHESSD